VPATALVNDAEGLRVDIVDGENKIHLVPIKLERDAGGTVQIASGVDATSRVVKSATADLVEGRAVQVRQ
jgi:hypothetical protein